MASRPVCMSWFAGGSERVTEHVIAKTKNASFFRNNSDTISGNRARDDSCQANRSAHRRSGDVIVMPDGNATRANMPIR